MVANTNSIVANQATPNQATAVFVQKPVPIQQPLVTLDTTHLTLARSRAALAQDTNVWLAVHLTT